MTALFQHLIDIMTLGSLYALLGLGIALVFGIMRLVNFAHGELVMVGGFAAITLESLPSPIVAAGAVGIPILVAVALERVVFRPVRGGHETTLLATSFAVSYLLQNLAYLVYGATPRSINLGGSFSGFFAVHGVIIPKLSVVTIGATVVLLISLSLFLMRTSLGVQMRAAAEDFMMARVMGVRANRVIACAFAISGLLAGVAAYLVVAQSGSVYPTMGLNAILVAFIATVLGGLGSPIGAVVGGYTLGLLVVVLDAYLPADLRGYRDAFAYTIVIAVLVLRPTGIVRPRNIRVRV